MAVIASQFVYTFHVEYAYYVKQKNFAMLFQFIANFARGSQNWLAIVNISILNIRIV